MTISVAWQPGSSVRRLGRILPAVCLVLTTSWGCSPAEPESPATVEKQLTFSILEDYDKGDDLGEVGRDFDLFAELGVKTWRGSFGWDDYEPTRGTYDFEWLHRFAALAAERGITLRPYIAYTPEWAAAGGGDAEVWNDPPTDFDAWSQFVRTLATEMRRHANIRSYEIYNEENARQWWDGTADAYRELLRRASEAVKAGNPDAQVVLGGMVFPDIEWIEAVCADQSVRVDLIPFHAYPETWEDVPVESYLDQGFASGFVAASDAACGRTPLWMNEVGYATTPGRTELDQAHWWARAIATFAAEPRVEHIGVYEIKDLARDRDVIGDAPNYHLGLTDVSRRKKLAFGTVARLVSMLGSQPFVPSRPSVQTSGSPGQIEIYRHLFTRKDGRRILVLWTRAGDAVASVEVGGNAVEAIEYAIDGRTAGRVPIANGVLRDISLKPGIVRMFEIP